MSDKICMKAGLEPIDLCYQETSLVISSPDLIVFQRIKALPD